MGGGGRTQTSTTTGDIAPTLRPAAQQTIQAAGDLYNYGGESQLGRLADDQTTGALRNVASDTRSSVIEQQEALGGAARDIRDLAGGLQPAGATRINPATGQRELTAIGEQYSNLAQENLGQQRAAQALSGGLGGARALRANNQLSSNLGSQLAAVDEQAKQQAIGQQANLYGQAGQLGAQSAALGTQGAEADLIAAQSAQNYQQQQLDRPGQALAQYGQLLQTPGSFVGTSSTTTAPRGGK